MSCWTFEIHSVCVAGFELLQFSFQEGKSYFCAQNLNLFCLYLMPLKHEVPCLFHLMQHNWQSKEQIGLPGPCTVERLELEMLCGLAWALLLRPRNSCPERCCGAGSWTVHQQDKQSLCYQAAPFLSTEGLQGGFTIITHILSNQHTNAACANGAIIWYPWSPGSWNLLVPVLCSVLAAAPSS